MPPCRRYVDRNLPSGFSSAGLVGRDLADETCIGWATRKRRYHLRIDHIFCIFSNAKLITACAALLLFEQGRFRLMIRNQTEPAARPIAIGHLMSHCSALSYGLFDPGTLIFSA